MVSDVFEATQGDFLKLGYRATGAGDWYHVASYLVDSVATLQWHSTNMESKPMTGRI